MICAIFDDIIRDLFRDSFYVIQLQASVFIARRSDANDRDIGGTDVIDRGLQVSGIDGRFYGFL
jgi:hypothetical protein